MPEVHSSGGSKRHFLRNQQKRFAREHFAFAREEKRFAREHFAFAREQSDFLVADEVASFSRDLSTLRRTPAWPSATVPRPSHSKRNNFLKSFRKDVFSDPSRVSYG